MEDGKQKTESRKQKTEGHTGCRINIFTVRAGATPYILYFIAGLVRRVPLGTYVVHST